MTYTVWWSENFSEEDAAEITTSFGVEEAVEEYCKELEDGGDFVEGHPQHSLFKARDSDGTVHTFVVHTEYEPSFIVNPGKD